MNAVVVGGGLLGLSTGYYLARAGHQVTVLEAGPQLGGLATDVDVGGLRVDRFYHCILNADDHLIQLIDEVDLRDQFRMRAVSAGFYHHGKISPISTPLDLLRFPPLSLPDRLRLVRSLLACRRVKDWHRLESVDVETWLRGLSGDRVFETVWRPLLSAKFNGDFARIPATYIWSRTVRMTDTRSAAATRELTGYLVGGYRTLAERLAERIVELGGQVLVNRPAETLITRAGAIQAVRTRDELFECDAGILTVPLPLAARLMRGRLADGESSERESAIDAYIERVESVQDYLGVICVLLMLDAPLSEHYTLYLGDSHLPFTAVIETTNLIDPSLVGGRHLVYLPKYLDPDSELFEISDDAVRLWFLTELRRIFPALRDEQILASPVFRARHVEPLHPLGNSDTIPPTQTPITGLSIGSTKHFYPRLNNGDAVTRLGARLAAEVDAARPAIRPSVPAASPLDAVHVGS